MTVLSVSPVSNVTTKLPPANVTASSKVTVISTESPSLYVPSAVVEVTEEIVGAVVSITKDLLAPKEFASPTVGSVKVAGLPAISLIEPPFRTNADVEA